METYLSKPPRLINYTEEGGHWFQRLDDGGTFVLTKDDMKHEEDIHIRPEHYMPGYNPIWCYNWKILELQAEDEIGAKAYFSSLTLEQLILIQEIENLYLELKDEVNLVDKMSQLEKEVWKQNNPTLIEKVEKCLAWKNLGIISL